MARRACRAAAREARDLRRRRADAQGRAGQLSSRRDARRRRRRGHAGQPRDGSLRREPRPPPAPGAARAAGSGLASPSAVGRRRRPQAGQAPRLAGAGRAAACGRGWPRARRGAAPRPVSGWPSPVRKPRGGPMNTVLVVLLIGFMILAVVSLVRGIIAFLQSSKSDLETPGTGATPMQLKQNKMMFNRIMFQGLAIVVVALLLLFNS